MLTKSQLDKMIGTLGRKLPKTPNFVYRDHLTQNDKPSLPKKLQRSPKIVDIYRDEYLDAVPDDIDEKEINYSKELSFDSSGNSSTVTKSGNNLRVKVLMTKKEAEMLLSKCKEKNSLEFKDVITELSRLPAPRIDVVSIDDVAPCWGPPKALATIYEED